MREAIALVCPGCAADYLLPTRLLGSLGARVSCPACGAGFVVEGPGVPSGPDAPAHRAPQQPAAADGVARAAEALDRLEARGGDALAEAARSGQLFARFGPELLAAWDEVRRGGPEPAGRGAFLRGLRARWGVDLLGGA